MNARENWLRAVEFRYPEWVPCRVVFSPLNWKLYRQELEAVVWQHPRLFPDFVPGSVDYDTMPESSRIPLPPGGVLAAELEIYRSGERYDASRLPQWRNLPR
jgi:hypothetical protein